jgi:hypothetical protein
MWPQPFAAIYVVGLVLMRGDLYEHPLDHYHRLRCGCYRKTSSPRPLAGLVGAVIGAVIVLVVWGFLAPRDRRAA